MIGASNFMKGYHMLEIKEGYKIESGYHPTEVLGSLLPLLHDESKRKISQEILEIIYSSKTKSGIIRMNEKIIEKLDFLNTIDLYTYKITMGESNDGWLIYLNNHRYDNVFDQIQRTHGSISNFDYYTDVEHPEEYSDEEWSHREKVWMNLMVKDQYGLPKFSPKCAVYDLTAEEIKRQILDAKLLHYKFEIDSFLCSPERRKAMVLKMKRRCVIDHLVAMDYAKNPDSYRFSVVIDMADKVEKLTDDDIDKMVYYRDPIPSSVTTTEQLSQLCFSDWASEGARITSKIEILG